MRMRTEEGIGNMHFEKHTFHAWYEKHEFYHPLECLLLIYNNPCIKFVFPKRTFNIRSGKHTFFNRPVLRTLLDVRRPYVMNKR